MKKGAEKEKGSMTTTQPQKKPVQISAQDPTPSKCPCSKWVDSYL